MINKKIGLFSSSQIYNLMTNNKSGDGFGKPCLSYIEEKKMEMLINRTIDQNNFSHPTSWGRILEKFVFENYLKKDQTKYNYVADITIFSDKIERYCGTPDLISDNMVSDIKCPFSLKSFCQLVTPIHFNNDGDVAIQTLRKSHPDGEKYYWQLISNAILTNCEYAELIVYCPYKNELMDLYNFISLQNEGDQYDYYWIFQSIIRDDGKLPSLPNDSNLKSMNKIKFKVLDSDREKLINRLNDVNDFINGK